jgi:co-chaperonin GroES (HSP10)
MNVRPLQDRILVKRLEESAHRAGSIIIPEPAKEKPQHGKVIAGRAGHPLRQVLSGQEIKLGGCFA